MIIKKFFKPQVWDAKFQCHVTPQCTLVHANKRELSELRRRNELLWKVLNLWTVEGYAARGERPQGKLAHVSHDMTIDEVLCEFNWAR